MSVTIEDKIEMFRKMLFGNIELDSSKRKEALQKELDERMKELKRQIELQKQEIMSEAIGKADRERQQLVAKARAEEQHRLLISQQGFIEQLIELITQKAERFARTQNVRESEYGKYLSRAVSDSCRNFNECNSIVLYFNENDIVNNKEFICELLVSAREEKKFELRLSTDCIIGGFIVMDSEGILQADYSLLSIIEENRDKLGLSVSRMFEEVMS